MRLLNTATLELTEFWENEVPQYAILSHTWEKEEVSFQDIQNGNSRNKAGYAKILGCCRQAALDKLEYIWIDTCCIDKSSSAELTEAINSMYKWYRSARVCYAYLADIESTIALNSELRDEGLARSRWFTRGWTLQELIAPYELQFYSQKWHLIGSKSELTGQLSDITGVPKEVFLDSQKLRYTSVAARMSWASRRVTTRKEDIAYCLMGIFEINMPLLYGEGERAFTRLQEEIIKVSNDHSLFAWTNPSRKAFSGMLAGSPKYFSKSQNIVGTLGPGRKNPCAITNCGLRIELALVDQTGTPKDFDQRGVYIAILDCVDSRFPELPIGIKMSRSSLANEKAYCRVGLTDLWTVRDARLNSTKIPLHSEVLFVSTELWPSFIESAYKWNSKTSQVSEGFVLHGVHSYDKWAPYKY